MITALDENGSVVEADNVDISKQYYCKLCGKPVLIGRFLPSGGLFFFHRCTDIGRGEKWERVSE